MIAKVFSMGLNGIDGFTVEVECDVSIGLPSFDVVGLPDTAVKESKERVRAAIKNTGYSFLPRRITVNLAPADVKKEGSVYDLSICLGILLATEQLDANISDSVFLAELSLSGELRHTNGILPMVISAKQLGFKKVFVPLSNALEAAIVDGIDIYGCKDIGEIILHLKGEKHIDKFTLDEQDVFINKGINILDFCDVSGQLVAKRALEIAAAGGHNVLMIGPPGTGKSMLAKRIPTILPQMTFEESIMTTKIHSVAGVLPADFGIITTRPFRSPHHTISTPGLAGGGKNPKPGEVSLAHNGVLFLDEFAEFSKSTLDVLRQPLEDGKITIARVNGTVSYPCEVMLVCATNPCKCGYFGHPSKPCVCSPAARIKYMSKISGPIMDRIDIQAEVSSVTYSELNSKTNNEKSADILKRVEAARSIARRRYEGTGISCNARLTSAMMKKVCKLDEQASNALKMVYDKLGLSARGHDKILKIARTIADLDNSEDIKINHILEAVQYRSLDKKYWGR